MVVTAKTKIEKIRSSLELGVFLRNYRLEQALTIRETSQLVGLGERFISEVERGKATAFLDKALHYINLLGLGLQVYPRNSSSVAAPYGVVSDLNAIGSLARDQRKVQNATLETVSALSQLSLRFLSDFERGKNCQIGKALSALNAYGLEIVIAPRGYRLSKVDLFHVR